MTIHCMNKIRLGMNRTILALVSALILATVSPGPSAWSQERIDVAFSPGSGAESLIVRTISSAKSSIRLAAWAFSSPTIISALLAAKNRGVDVQVVVDAKHNVEEDEKGIGQKALTRLAGANIPVRLNSGYRKHHDKFIIVDDRHVQTGSYNYAASANRNSENVLVVWNDPALAARYQSHWRSRFGGGSKYAPN